MTMLEVGPIQMVALRFDADAEFEGKILAELSRLQRESTIRLLDLMLLGADADSGEPVEIDFKDRQMGSIVGPLLGIDAAELQPRDPAAGDGLLNREAVQSIAPEIREIAEEMERIIRELEQE